jgi:elongation factor G
MTTFPLSQLVKFPLQPKPSECAHSVMQSLALIDVEAKAVSEGLHLSAMDEASLEVAVASVLHLHPGAKPAKPQLTYIYGERILEPYAVLEIIAPAECEQQIYLNLVDRRACNLALAQTQKNCKLTGEVPMTELFGYGTYLQMCTQGRGNFRQSFLEFRPVARSRRRRLTLR